MVHLIDDLVPSNLIYTEGLPPATHWSLQEATGYRESGDYRNAQRLVEKIARNSRLARSHCEYAAAMVYLSDIYRETFDLDQALHHATEAHSVFERQIDVVEQHNVAVSAYNLGFVHHLLGDEREALKWYQTAAEKFASARWYWGSNNEKESLIKCQRVEQWIDVLIDAIERREIFCSARFLMLLPVVRTKQEEEDPEAEEELDMTLAQLEIDQELQCRRTLIGGEAFLFADPDSIQLALPVSNSPTIKRREDYRIFKIPPEAFEQLHAPSECYLLGRRAKSEETEGKSVVIRESTIEFGKFQRSKEGKVVFNQIAPEQLRIIGNVNDAYDQVALLRPAKEDIKAEE